MQNPFRNETCQVESRYSFETIQCLMSFRNEGEGNVFVLMTERGLKMNVGWDEGKGGGRRENVV